MVHSETEMLQSTIITCGNKDSNHNRLGANYHLTLCTKVGSNGFSPTMSDRTHSYTVAIQGGYREDTSKLARTFSYRACAIRYFNWLNETISARELAK
jgi:hypothetical protein